MNALVEKGYLSERPCGSNFSYILNDNSMFLPTQYKVLQSQTKSGFVKCMKVMYNGKVQLYYVTRGLKPFYYMLSTLDPDSFMIIAANVMASIIETKNIGFLSCQNIDISFEHIYVEPNTYKVHLMYLPINNRIYGDYSAFENELRTGFVKLISSLSNLSSPKTIQFSADLANGMLTLEDLYSRVKGGKSANVNIPKKPEKPIATNISAAVKLTAMNAPGYLELNVTKDEYVIGKNASAVDGVVSFNKMISRVHCKINKYGNQVTITDLKSANGTYVNKMKLQPNQPYPVKNGDIIRLANSDFQISIR